MCAYHTRTPGSSLPPPPSTPTLTLTLTLTPTLTHTLTLTLTLTLTFTLTLTQVLVDGAYHTCVVTTRAVEAREELTYDYGEAYWAGRGGCPT